MGYVDNRMHAPKPRPFFKGTVAGAVHRPEPRRGGPGLEVGASRSALCDGVCSNASFAKLSDVSGNDGRRFCKLQPAECSVVARVTHPSGYRGLFLIETKVQVNLVTGFPVDMSALHPETDAGHTDIEDLKG